MAELPLFVSIKEYNRFEEFKRQVGDFDSPKIFPAFGAEQWFGEDIDGSEMAIRTVVRRATLKRLGYDRNDYWFSDSENGPHTVDKSQIKEVLGLPNYKHYEWHLLSGENLGQVDLLDREGEPFIDTDHGIVLFADEVQQLKDGQTVSTYHSSGLGSGYIVERKEAVMLVEGNLLRVRGLLSD